MIENKNINDFGDGLIRFNGSAVISFNVILLLIAIVRYDIFF